MSAPGLVFYQRKGVSWLKTNSFFHSMTLRAAQTCIYHKIVNIHISKYESNNWFDALRLSTNAFRRRGERNVRAWYWEGSLALLWGAAWWQGQACRQAPALAVWLAGNVPEEQPSRFRPSKSVACDIRHPPLYTAARPARPWTQERPSDHL